MKNKKIKRLESDILRYLSDIIRNETNDELLKTLTITSVDLSTDLSYCKVYYTSLSNLDKKALDKEVNEASSFLRGKLSDALDIRHTPILKFIYDESLNYEKRIEEIIDSLN